MQKCIKICSQNKGHKIILMIGSGVLILQLLHEVKSSYISNVLIL